MMGVNVDEHTIDHLLELGTIAFESTGWGTGEVIIKCRSNTKCEKESLNKSVISFVVPESEIEENQVKEYAIRELQKSSQQKK